jgi:hypothetical protein
MLCGLQLNGKKLLRATKNLKSSQIMLNLKKKSQLSRCARAAKTHLAGHMRTAGRVFETPDVYRATNKAPFILIHSRKKIDSDVEK